MYLGCLYVREFMWVHMYKFSNSDKTATSIFQAMHAEMRSSFGSTFKIPSDMQRLDFSYFIYLFLLFFDYYYLFFLLIFLFFLLLFCYIFFILFFFSIQFLYVSGFYVVIFFFIFFFIRIC